MIRYFVCASLCSGLLLLVYKLFLEQEKIHRFNRLYLLLAIVFSYAVPCIIVQKTLVPNMATEQLNQVDSIVKNAVAINTMNWQMIAIYAFWLVSILLVVRLVYNLYKFASKISAGQKRNYQNAILILNDENQMPHSFLHYIFIGKDAFYNIEIEKEILHHELTHVKQRHTYDILFIEIIWCVLWSNPFIHFYKKSIQLNHEFLSDESVINSFGNIYHYQSLLLEKISKHKTLPMASSFNFGTIRKRLLMMSKSTSRKTRLSKQVMLLPCMLLSVYLFGQHITIQPEAIKELKTAKVETNTAESHTGNIRQSSNKKVKLSKPKKKAVQLSPITTTLSPLTTISTKLEGRLSPLNPLSTDSFEVLK